MTTWMPRPLPSCCQKLGMNPKNGLVHSLLFWLIRGDSGLTTVVYLTQVLPGVDVYLDLSAPSPSELASVAPHWWGGWGVRGGALPPIKKKVFFNRKREFREWVKKSSPWWRMLLVTDALVTDAFQKFFQMRPRAVPV